MKFQSTRNKNLRLESAETIVKGLSDDGGLFVPVEIPVLENGEIRISEEIADTSKIIAALVGAGIAVYELASVQGTLEQYYLNRTGGNV